MLKSKIADLYFNHHLFAKIVTTSSNKLIVSTHHNIYNKYNKYESINNTVCSLLKTQYVHLPKYKYIITDNNVNVITNFNTNLSWIAVENEYEYIGINLITANNTILSDEYTSEIIHEDIIIF